MSISPSPSDSVCNAVFVLSGKVKCLKQIISYLFVLSVSMHNSRKQ